MAFAVNVNLPLRFLNLLTWVDALSSTILLSGTRIANWTSSIATNLPVPADLASKLEPWSLERTRSYMCRFRGH